MDKTHHDRVEEAARVEEDISVLKRRISRRQAMKAGGIAAAGLVFVKPVIDTIKPPSVWGAVSPGGDPVPQPLPLLDQSYFAPPSNIGGGFTGGTVPARAQSFTAGITGILTGINFQTQGGDGTTQLQFDIHTTSAGLPTGSSLGSVVVIGSPIPITQLITLPPGINVVSGQQYAIVVTGIPGTSGSISGRNPGGYSGGTLLTNFSGVWKVTSGFDNFFRTYVL